jgi:hypothetical protein
MPVSTTETISIEEILKKLEVAGPLTATQLLNFFIGDTDQLRLIQRTTLNRLEGLSRTVLDNLTSEVYNKLKDPTISKKMVDPLGLVELRPEYKRKTEEILNKSVQNISNELGKIKIKEVELNESLNKSLENKINQIKVEDVDLNKIISDKIETIDLSSMVASLPASAPINTPPAPASTTTPSDLSTLLKDLNKTLKGLKRKSKTKQEPTKVTFSAEALKRLQNISGFDKGLIQQLEQRILSDSSTKIKQAFIRREMPGKRVVYEPGEKTIGLNEKSLRTIFDSLNISNDDQEKLLFALSTESKEIKDELKSFKKGMLESPWALLLNGISKFFTDLFLLGALGVGGSLLGLIGKYFGPSILGIVDKLFGTQLAPAFDNVTKPLQALGNKLTAMLVGVGVASAAILALGVAGYKLAAKLAKAALSNLIGKPLKALFAGSKAPTTTTSIPTPVSSAPPTGRITLPSGAYVEGGKAFSAAGKPLYGSVAQSVLSKASAVPPPPAPSAAPVVSGASRMSRLGRLTGRLGPYLAIAGESYRGYEEYSTEAEAIELQRRMGELDATEAERERVKAKGRAVGKTAIRTGSGLAGGFAGAKLGALAGGAIGSVVPIVGTAAGALIGGVVGGFGGYMAGQFAAEKTGLESIGSGVGESTSELLFSPPIESKTPNLQLLPEPETPSLGMDLKNTLQFAENKADESKSIQQQGFSSMIAGIGDMIGRLDQIREALLMSPGGGVANNVNILGSSGESSSDSVTTVSRIDPVLYNRSLYYNSIIGPRALT